MIGKTKEISVTVDREKLACTVGSGSLEVFATPMMIAAMEQAACTLLQEFLEEGQTSVGTMMHVAHSAATPLGMQVTAAATITAQEGRKVEFEVSARDACGEIGRGTHTRFIVDAAKFLSKTNAKREAAE
ncbi:thioesterase family protein [Anaerotruncus sp. 1XD42-93]|jgi:predicted thioesterase|uniref:thioesterase family protein n=1 Tax=Anaerotruncus sp. 1XD42-93 TaxID=2320853 RepID=UPI000EA0623B|nr:thioesterase family protein [Anaerotruncus sp. 1XD42-93]NBK17423.1 dihydrolipoamide acyltransferase [Anaerotruncus sp. 1XD42-93]NCE74273.1 dihydrolipoamide acyltransferase [Anaerotruncus sp. X29]RKJ96025.1 dihydrolipoamide acyltransferase [Anaerotruncus sp. 1XD22-93]